VGSARRVFYGPEGKDSIWRLRLRHEEGDVTLTALDVAYRQHGTFEPMGSLIG
jgi:hypothetical protein